MSVKHLLCQERIKTEPWRCTRKVKNRNQSGRSEKIQRQILFKNSEKIQKLILLKFLKFKCKADTEKSKLIQSDGKAAAALM